MADLFEIAGRIHSTSQEEVVTIADEILDSDKNKKQSNINAEVDATLAEHTSTIQGLNSQNYMTYAVASGETPSDVLPATGSIDTVYRVGNWDGTQFDETCYSEYSWNGSSYVHISTKIQIGEVFDISAYHASGNTLATYDDLADALDGGNNVPSGLRKGGMSIKFVQSSDNKYVQARCMAQNFTTDINQWQGIDECPTAGSDNLVKSGGVDEIINGTSVIKETSFESPKWYTHTSVGEPLTLVLQPNCFAYKGVIPQGTVSIDVFGKGSTGGRLWYTLDSQENVVRMSGTDMTSEHISIQDTEVYIVVQTNNVYTNQGKIIFYNIDGINQRIEELRNKLIKLAKLGSAGNPIDLQVGDIYTPNGRYLIQVDAITDGVITGFHNVPFIDGALYTLNSVLYHYNGTMLVPASCGIYEDTCGLSQGYILESYTNDTSRVSTKFINALTHNLHIKLNSDSYEIRGIAKFNSNLGYIEYISDVDRHEVTLDSGFYYSVVFSNVDTSADITPEEVAPYILINDQITLDTINSSFIFGKGFNVSELAEPNTWYTGQTIGEELQKTTYSNCYAIKLAVNQGEIYTLSAKGATGGRGWYLLDGSNKVVDLAPADFNDTVTLQIPEDVSYLITQSNDGLGYLSLSLLGKVDELQKDVEQLQQNIQNISTTIDSFKCITPFLWNKLSRMKSLATGFCNIGFIGDSWTQGTEDSIVQGKFEGYVKHLTKMLQDEYGYGGLGWLDFARDGGVGKMFGCAEMYESWSYSFAGNVTGVDAAGSSSTPAAQCFGICVAHTIFGNASSLTLNFNAGVLDKFVLRYYKNAHFNVSVNGGNAIEVIANSTDGWQETEFGVTGTDTTSVVITSLADDSIIFGMDCFYGNHGVRIHKIGNRSISSYHYITMDATQWETGISKLNLCWASVLLGINDLGSHTEESYMDAVVTRISTLIDRLKVATDDGNGLVTCDINLLGVDGIEATGFTGLGRLAEKQKIFALNNGYGWCSTDKCIGSKKAEFVHNGTFSDTIHLNKIGSYAYAKHIYNSLFTF